MGMGESWGSGLLGAFIAKVGGFLTFIGIFIGMSGHGYGTLIFGVIFLAAGSYMKYVSSQSVRVVEIQQEKVIYKQAPATHSHADKLEQLKKMKDKGLITHEEYEAKKQSILDAL